ncbi:hypothetical protein H0H87_003820 [Tephrocybe sp. NHM501043]|nr:hypothetical protein H0H87_003820 [Tephrocybe sp. NHM501043]
MRHQLTPEQIALSEERKAKKLKSGPPPSQNTDTGHIIERAWIPIEPSPDSQQGDQRITVFTWNLLAQCLVRRDLFPTSDCLKAGQREQMLYRELLSTQADILCLQEVDRLEKILPALEKAGYAHHYATGPGKKHGCLIAFKEETYAMISSKTVFYDSEQVRDDGDGNGRCGRSFHTKNIGSLVALQTKSAGKAEDFNFAPNDPAYSLLVGDPILPEQQDVLAPSYVVHRSVDPTVPKTPKAEQADGNEEGGDPDKVITSARPATPSDGLLSPIELSEFFSRIPKLRSAYDVGLAKVEDLKEVETFGSRISLGTARRGRHEPAYTSYTHYWKTTLDYLFVLDPIDRPSSIVALLSPHRTKDLERGLPQKAVSSSDHVSLAAKLRWQKRGEP